MSALPTGRIILLNGTSSAGKSSIGHALQLLLSEPHLLFEIDTFIAALPPHVYGKETGWMFVPADDGSLRGHVGVDAAPIFAAMYYAMAALAHGGVNVIFVDVCLGDDAITHLLDAWRDIDVVMVGVRCPVAVLEARERARGNRAIGIARGMREIAHAGMLYDIEVDTSTLSPEECAAAIVPATSWQKPRAIEAMRSTRR